MEIIGFYLLFAITTGIVFLLELYNPVYQELKLIKKDLGVVSYPVLGFITMFLLAVLTAPIAIIPCLVPKSGENFKRELLNSFLE